MHKVIRDTATNVIMLILLHFTAPTSEGRSVVMNFGNDKHSFNCWLSAIRMGIFGRKKLKDSFEGLSNAAANSPVSSKSKEGVGLGDFRLFSKFGKLRLMAGGGGTKNNLTTSKLEEESIQVG